MREDDEDTPTDQSVENHEASESMENTGVESTESAENTGVETDQTEEQPTLSEQFAQAARAGSTAARRRRKFP